VAAQEAILFSSSSCIYKTSDCTIRHFVQQEIQRLDRRTIYLFAYGVAVLVVHGTSRCIRGLLSQQRRGSRSAVRHQAEQDYADESAQQEHHYGERSAEPR